MQQFQLGYSFADSALQPKAWLHIEGRDAKAKRRSQGALLFGETARCFRR